MRLRHLLIVVAAISLLGHSACQSGPTTATSATAPAGAIELTFLHTNDSHGQTLGTGKVGGYGRVKSAVDDYRAQTRQPVMLIDGGDISSRGDDLTMDTQGRANIDIMAAAGYELWVPGNGDFYNGLDNLRALAKQARFPTLGANLKLLSTGEYVFEPYVIRQMGPVKVAFFGLCFLREDSKKGLVVESPIETARRLVPLLRGQADVVVALTHIGVADDRELARQVTGIDLIIGAHTHTLLPTGETVAGPDGWKTLISQAGDTLVYLGVDKLVVVPTGASAGGHAGAPGRSGVSTTSAPARVAAYRVASATAKVRRLDDTVKIDPQITALIARLAAQTSKPASQPVPVGYH